MEKQETDTESENGNDLYQISILCKFLVLMTELDACMCAVVCDKLVWTVLCAVG